MVNKVILIGNVGHNPEIRTLSDTKVARLSIACTESYKASNGEKITTTEWVKLVAWRHLADIIEQYVHRGQQVYVEGKLRTTTHENKEGQKVYTTNVEVSTILMLGKKDTTVPVEVPVPPKPSHASAQAAEVYGNGGEYEYEESPVRKTWEPDMSKQKEEDDPGNDLPF